MNVRHAACRSYLTHSVVHDLVQGLGRMEGAAIRAGTGGGTSAEDGVAAERPLEAFLLFFLLLAAATLLIFTLVMLRLKTQMLLSKKQKDCEEAPRPSSPVSPPVALPLSHPSSPPTTPLSPPPPPPVTPRTPLPHTPPLSPADVMQPSSPSPPFVELATAVSATPLGASPPVAETAVAGAAFVVVPFGTPPACSGSVPRAKAKGLLERRGSSASLTIELHPSQETASSLPAPTRECTTDEFLLSAGNALSRGQLRTCLRDTRVLHREFWDIPPNYCERVEVAGSGVKNRYRSILPNEHSRVRLVSPGPGVPEDLACYINANFIRGYDGEERAYIATQGPLPHTVADFWLMVWEQKAPAIVMMTKLQEKARPKCEAYLPPDPDPDPASDDGSSSHDSLRLGTWDDADDTDFSDLVGGDFSALGDSSDLDGPVDLEDSLETILEPQSPLRPVTPGSPITFGDITIVITKVKRNAGYVVRELRVQRGDEVRTVLHYWYDTWPDHKTPPSAHCLVALALEVERRRRMACGPIVVHCSAGIGRTGCFIAVSIGTNQLLEEDTVDVLGIVCRLRHDRGGMVQTAEQYEFVHRALALFERSLPDK